LQRRIAVTNCRGIASRACLGYSPPWFGVITEIFIKRFKINNLHKFLRLRDVSALGLLSGLCAGLLLADSAMAQTRLLWACMGEGGKRNFYTSERTEAQGKDCLRIEEPASNHSGSGAGGGAARLSAPPARGAAAPGPSASQSRPETRVEPATQRSRDEVRRRILQTELEDEEKRLQAAKEKLAAAGKTARPAAELAAVEQHEKNITELKRTLAAIR
jgi:hypothetical protein